MKGETRTSEAPHPLSFAQRRLWFLHQLQPDSAAYHALDAVRLRGPLRSDALVHSLNATMARHAVLRTRFTDRDGEPVQDVMATLTWPLQRIDLSHLDASQQAAEIRRLADQQQHRPFDLALGPLVEAVLIELRNDDHVLLLRLHHVVADGWSIGLLRRELAAHYGAYCSGAPAPLPPLPCQYTDFAAWQRDWLSSDKLDELLGYWRQQLSGLPALNLPTDRPRPATPSGRGRAAVREVPRALLEAISVTAQRMRATPFMVLLAAFQVLLSRYSGQFDFAVGTPVANRSRREWEGLIGFFVNTLVMRADLRGDPTFRELVDRVRTTALEAYSYQELPFELQVQELAPQRDPSRNPLFQVTFGVHNLPPTNWTLANLEVGPVDFEITTSRFDLEMNLWEHPQGLRIVAFCSEELFEPATIERLLQHYERLLQGIAAHPERRLSELPLLTDTERRDLLITWNKLPTEQHACRCLHELFEAQSARTPDRIAVTDAAGDWTYAELDNRAKQLGRRLRALGVGAEVPVALCLNRTAEMVAAMLGVFKAGGAYVPLEPDLPTERLAYLLDETRALVVVTESSILGQLPHRSGVAVYCVDTNEVVQAPSPSGSTVRRTAGPDNLAYLMYTSGTSGRPKAVQVTHLNVVRLLEVTQTDYEFGPDDVWTMFHSYAFDFSVWEIWGALLFGGRLVLVPWDVCRSPREFRRLLVEQKVTVLNQTPTAFGQLLSPDDPWQTAELSLKWIIFGGERLDPRLVADWFKRFGPAPTRLANMYGITETTVHASLFVIHAEELNLGRSIIGRRLADLQLYVLDGLGQLVPPGVPGEIHVGGSGLARGYWQDSALTADRFRPHPFSSVPGARLYRTGDRGRFRNDGVLEYLGRGDAQVKVRGIRIEPAEVESALRRIPAVRDALVLTDDSCPDDQRLVAYVVTEDGRDIPVDELQKGLRRWLPAALIPSSFVHLRELPRNAQGKVDRRALPAPSSARPALTVSFVAPRTPIERGIAEIWQETLQLERVGAHDNFFDLGGHSLQATRVVSRIRESFQVQLPLQRLFTTPVLADLAEQVEFSLRSGPAPALRPLLAGCRRSPPRLSYAQQRLWVLCQLRPRSGAYHIPLVMEFRGRPDVQALQRSLDAVVNRHEVLRTSFPDVDGQPLQRIAEEGRCPLTFVDWRSSPESQQTVALHDRAAAEQDQLFDLESGPLLRACLIQLQDERHVLLLTMHHIISDGWSIGVLRRELAEFYLAFRQGSSPKLPALSVQYADFAEWQREWFEGNLLHEQLDYWRGQLENLKSLQLPTDFPRRHSPSDRGGTETLTLPAALSTAVRELNRREGSTLFITLLAVFQALLSKYTGQTDVAVGSPIANRGNSQIENLIGFFVNTLVLRARLEDDPTFRELLHQVRQTALAAYTHQDLPFERLVEELQPDRVLDQNPLFQVMFAVQNAPLGALELAGLTVHSLPYPVTTTRFDLQWDVFEQTNVLQIVAYYRSELFHSATVQRMLRHFELLLQRAVANPDIRLSELSVLDDSERASLLVAWNDTVQPYPADSTVHQILTTRCSQSAETVAVVDRERHWTYRELNEFAERVARRLKALGVCPETPIGLCAERNGEMIAAMIGILQAGAAYVPLDLEQPHVRLQRVLEHAKIGVVVMHRCEERFQLKDGIQTIYLDDLRNLTTPSRQDCETALPCVTANNLACVMYTSGSTGAPKGIGVSHRAILRLVLGTGPMRITERDVVAQASNPSFDAATYEIWGALLNGSRLVFVSRETLLHPSQLDVQLQQSGISVLFLTTALFNVLIRDNPARFASLRCLLFGGEAVDAARVRQVLLHKAPVCLLHMYGPTECTTFSTAFPVLEVAADATTVPIGRPIANTQVFVLDEQWQPVPVGVSGELYVGGPGLARGYWNAPVATAERFIPHPFADEPGQRLYRTGDLARFRSDGNIEFLSRRDDQVKLRGFRIEPGEIRQALREHPAVGDCHLILREKDPGDTRLVAYITTNMSAILVDTQQRQLLDDWRRFYDDLYVSADPTADPRFDLVGWTSSYSGRPISALAMREQVDQTVDRILRHQPKRVLEIGAGTGLLLFRIARHCEQYWATDISPVAADRLRQKLEAAPDLGHVRVRECSAEGSTDQITGTVDTVILNSVVQYFPSIDYLRSVLEQVSRVLAPGGIIFLGDIRHLGLWEAFQTTVELLRAPRLMPANEVRNRIAFEMEQETELLVHPAFFRNMATDLPGVTEVRIEPKRGAQQNELTQFRYDVTIRFGGNVPAAANGVRQAAAGKKEDGREINQAWLGGGKREPVGRPSEELSDTESMKHDWSELPLSLSDLRQRLETLRPGRWVLRNVANSRVSTATEAAQALRDSRMSAGELRDRLFLRSQQPEGLDPEELWQLAVELGYHVDLDWSDGHSDGRFHVAWQATEPNSTVSRPAFSLSFPTENDLPLVLGNRPLADRVSAQLSRQLREHLKQRLPEFMIPTSFVVLDKLPLTAQGKVDRSRLPPPSWPAPTRAGGEDRALTATEDSVARIWCEVLRLTKVGLHDNFFDLGGHSLLAMQVVTRLRERFAVELPVRGLFQAPTVAELALLLTQQAASLVDEATLLQQLEELESMSDEQVRNRYQAEGVDDDE